MQGNREVKAKKSATRRTVEHCFRWLRSGSESYRVENPMFNHHSPSKVAIYCVHGTCDRTGSFDYFVSHTIQRLPSYIDSINVIAFENRGKGISIDEFAEQLKDQIVANVDQDIILIGHSRGGLVLSHFTLYLAADNHIRVHLPYSLCAPYKGSYLALAPLTFFSASVAQMSQDSAYLRALSQLIRESGINFVYVGATHDKVVAGDSFLPYEIVGNDNNHLLLQDETHLSSMSSPEMIEHFLHHIHALGLQMELLLNMQLLEETQLTLEESESNDSDDLSPLR